MCKAYSHVLLFVLHLKGVDLSGVDKQKRSVFMPELTKPTHATQTMSTQKLVSLAMLCAVAYLVMYLSKTIFAPIKVAGLLTFDLKDTIIAIGGFLYGPVSAFILSTVVSLIEMVTHSETGPVGLLMNVLSTVSFVCPAAWLYQRKHTSKGAVSGLVVGAVLMTAVMMLWNYLITPMYQQVPREVVAGMLLPVFMPFNLVKAAMNASLTMVLYKPVVTALRKARLAPESTGQAEAKSGISKFSVSIVGVFVLATAILLALVLAGKL